MWESTERGYLTLNEKPVITLVISKMVGVDITEMEKALQQMEQFNVFSRREDGAIFCRKMVRDEDIRQLKAKAGRKGMKKRYSKKPVITPVITKHEDETEIEYESKSDIIIKDEYSFINFWNLYDKKVGEKNKIENKYNKLSLEVRKKIFEYIPLYIKSQPNKQYRKNPETFLNNKGWNDEIIKQQKDGKRDQYTVGKVDYSGEL